MAIEEIIGAVIDSGFVTNDPARIDAALLCRHGVQYVSRDRAKSLAMWTDRTEWDALASGPAMGVIVEGVFYGRSEPRPTSPVSFEMAGLAPSAVPMAAG